MKNIIFNKLKLKINNFFINKPIKLIVDVGISHLHVGVSWVHYYYERFWEKINKWDFVHALTNDDDRLIMFQNLTCSIMRFDVLIVSDYIFILIFSPPKLSILVVENPTPVK